MNVFMDQRHAGICLVVWLDEGNAKVLSGPLVWRDWMLQALFVGVRWAA